MQRLFMSLVLIIMFLMAALVAAPLFVDLDEYKKELSYTIESATGLRSEINGTISVSFFPAPVIKVSNVSVANIEGAASANLLSVEHIEVQSSFKSLLSGSVDIETIHLVEPVLELETLKDGNSSWKLLSDKFRKRSLPDGFKFPENIMVKNGTISYREKNKRKTIDYISAEIEADSFIGPFALEGNFSDNENIIKFEGEVDELEDGSEASFALSSDSLLIKMDGNYKAGERPGIQGKVEGNTTNLANFIKLFFDSGSVFSKIKSEETMSLKGQFMLSSHTAVFNDMYISSDSLSGVANIDALLSEKGDSLQWDIAMDVKKIDFDKLFAEEKKLSASDEVDYYATSLKSTSIADYKFDIPQSLNALFKLSIDEVKYHDQKITNLMIDTDIFNGKATVHKVAANLPGNSEIKFVGNVEHNGVRPLLSGVVSASGESLRTVVWWLFSEMSFIPPGELGKYLFNCDLKMTPQKIDILNMNLSVDKTLLTGDIFANPARAVPVIKADIQIDRMNLDRYGMSKKITDRAREFISAAAKKGLESSWLKIMNMKMDLSLDGSELVYNGYDVENFIASLAIHRGVFALQKLLLKSEPVNLDGNLYINLNAEKPTIEVNVESSGFDTAFFLKGNEEKASDEWSEDPFNLLGIDKFDGKAKLAFQEIKHKDLALEKVVFEGNLNRKVFNITKASAELYGGKAAVKGNIGVREKSPSFGISVVMSNVGANELTKVFMDSVETDGRIYLSGTAKTFGGNPAKWAKEMNVEAKFAGRDILVKSFDLNSIVANSRKLYSVIDMHEVVKKAMSEGETVFNSIEGNISSARAVMSLKDFKLITNTSRGVFAGNINMLNGDIKGAARIAFRPEIDKKVALGVNIDGSIGEIIKIPDTKQLDAYITSKGRR